MPVTTLSIP
ncbi:hypothetical protein ECFRIK523_5191, partial [Escherichia coli FRIK523]